MTKDTSLILLGSLFVVIVIISIINVFKGRTLITTSHANPKFTLKEIFWLIVIFIILMVIKHYYEQWMLSL